MKDIKTKIRMLYSGKEPEATYFRYALIIFDILTILYFIITAPLLQSPLIATVNTILGLLILCDFAARLWVAHNRQWMLIQIYTVADILVVLSLLLGPLILEDLAFLRILRGLRLIHSYHLIRDLRRESRFFRQHEDAIFAAVNLFVFIFVTTSFVFATAFDNRSGVEAYIDALYFTVATLTTTGFGDITMTSSGGKLLSVFIMVVGVALFVQLARALFQRSKVRYKCAGCGLIRHDPDAIHCKHCGEPLRIETEGRSDAG